MKLTPIKFLSLFIIIISFATSCKKSDNTTAPSSTNASVVLNETNVTYGTETNQNFDIYLPANRTDTATKLVVLIHGGAWSAGDKSDFTSQIPIIQAGLQNFAFININYRLAAATGTNLWPTQQSDVNAAFDYIISKANYYHYNANKIVVLGTSAGAHLAMQKAYRFNNDNRIKAVINYYGPTDMTELYNFQTGFQQQLFELFMGGTPTTNSTAYANASPLNFVTSNSPATIIFHGTADAVVPISQSRKLDSALLNNNVVHQYIKYVGEPHGFVQQANINDSYTKAITFTLTNVK